MARVEASFAPLCQRRPLDANSDDELPRRSASAPARPRARTGARTAHPCHGHDSAQDDALHALILIIATGRSRVHRGLQEGWVRAVRDGQAASRAGNRDRERTRVRAQRAAGPGRRTPPARRALPPGRRRCWPTIDDRRPCRGSCSSWTSSKSSSPRTIALPRARCRYWTVSSARARVRRPRAAGLTDASRRVLVSPQHR